MKRYELSFPLDPITNSNTAMNRNIHYWFELAFRVFLKLMFVWLFVIVFSSKKIENNSAVFLQHQKQIVNYYVKTSSKNLSNENKQWCFCCLQDKKWSKMPILWKNRVRMFSLLIFFDELFDVIFDKPFLTL